MFALKTISVALSVTIPLIVDEGALVAQSLPPVLFLLY